VAVGLEREWKSNHEGIGTGIKLAAFCMDESNGFFWTDSL